ncbi:MAG: hypothetical protein ACOX28_04335 [Bacilli bacterium]|jgi:hypothetical protein
MNKKIKSLMLGLLTLPLLVSCGSKEVTFAAFKEEALNAPEKNYTSATVEGSFTAENITTGEKTSVVLDSEYTFNSEENIWEVKEAKDESVAESMSEALSTNLKTAFKDMSEEDEEQIPEFMKFYVGGGFEIKAIIKSAEDLGLDALFGEGVKVTAKGEASVKFDKYGHLVSGKANGSFSMETLPGSEEVVEEQDNLSMKVEGSLKVTYK